MKEDIERYLRVKLGSRPICEAVFASSTQIQIVLSSKKLDLENVKNKKVLQEIEESVSAILSGRRMACTGYHYGYDGEESWVRLEWHRSPVIQSGAISGGEMGKIMHSAVKGLSGKMRGEI